MNKAWIVLAFAIGCGSEDTDEIADPARATPCERLREHLVDLRLAGVESIDREAHREAHIVAMGNDFLAACATLPQSAVACATEATDSASAAACSAGASQ